MIGGSVARFLFQPGGSAAWNMAVDQAILESTGQAVTAAEAARPTLRFYTWAAPTLSLGYFQSAADCGAPFASLARVRRATGGGAILHHHELTYSLVVPTPVGQHGARHDLYGQVHESVIEVLRRHAISAQPHKVDPAAAVYQTQPACQGQPAVKRHAAEQAPASSAGEAFLCFARRTDEDLIVRGYKILGSAQRRVKGALLQHGSLLLAASEHTPSLPGLWQLCSRRLTPHELAPAIADQLIAKWGSRWTTGKLTETEKQRSLVIEQERFASPGWWARR